MERAAAFQTVKRFSLGQRILFSALLAVVVLVGFPILATANSVFATQGRYLTGIHVEGWPLATRN